MTLPIVDRVAFARAGALLLHLIPEHVNECAQCRQGEQMMQTAMDGRGPGEIDHAAIVAASKFFCSKGSELTTEFGQVAAASFGLPWPPR